MTRAALYARVSRKEDQDPENQLRRLREYAKIRNWTVYKEYVDKVSGVLDNRPALLQMRKHVRARWVDLVVVTKLDRLGRSVINLHETCEEMRAYGVEFVCLDQGIDTTTSSGRLTFTVLAGVAQFERELIGERTRDGLAKARAAGKIVGRHPKGCGCGVDHSRAKWVGGGRKPGKQTGGSDLYLETPTAEGATP